MGLPDAEFALFKNAYLSWLIRQIGLLKVIEERRSGRLEALDLEYKFGDVLKLLDHKASWLPIATYLAHQFDKQQMAVIYSLLDDLIDASVLNFDRGGFGAGFDAVTEFHSGQRQLE